MCSEKYHWTRWGRRLWLVSEIGAEGETGDIVRKRDLEIEGSRIEEKSSVSMLECPTSLWIPEVFWSWIHEC
jgi:hypothetical protein